MRRGEGAGRGGTEELPLSWLTNGHRENIGQLEFRRPAVRGFTVNDVSLHYDKTSVVLK